MKNQAHTFQIEYHTQNSYENPVKNAHWQLMVLPENNLHQERLNYTLTSNLEFKEYLTGNVFCGECINIQASGPFDDFNLSFVTTVNVSEHHSFEFDLLTFEKEKRFLKDHEFTIEHSHFLKICHLTDIPDSQAELFPKWGLENLTAYLQTLMDALNNFLEFTGGETEVGTTASQALEMRKGVCQDFTHIFTGLLRKQKIACRYVSGYLCQGLNYKGDAQLHAWVECFIPGGGWIGLDPSNNLFTDHNYVKITHGRNFEDCTPIRGVLETGGSNSTSHQVRIFQVQNEQ